MNKKLFLGMFAAAGMLLATSCSNDELDVVQSGNEAQVTFSLGLEGGIATRANISDGTKADKLVYAVYKLDANNNPILQKVVNSDEKSQFVKDDFKSGDNVSITLAKGQKYQVAFWAQDGDCKAYNTADLTKVSVSYKAENGTDDAQNNDELRDAFFKTVEFEVAGNKTIDVVLTRPFAQINVGVEQTDWDAAVASGIKINSSAVVIKNAANEINLLTGAVSGNETVVTYVSNTIPDETLYVETDNTKDGKEAYKWLSMSYILVADDTETDTDNDGTLGDARATLEGLQYTFTPESGNAIEFKEGLAGAPVQRNWRTNILGKILTGDIQFNITIDPAYDGDIIYPNGNEQELELEFAAAFGGEVTLTENVTLTKTLNVTADMILNLGDFTITGPNEAKDVDGNKIHAIVNNANLTINGGTVKSVAENGGSAIYNADGATLTIEDVEVLGAPKADGSWPSYAINNYGNLIVNDATVKSYHGGIATGGNGVTVIDNATVDVGQGQANRITSWALYVFEQGQLTVNAGKFENTKTDTNVNGGGYLCTLSSGETIINGGVFDNTVSTGLYVNGGKLTIKGGTFDKDVTTYVAEGYVAVANADGTYTVAKKVENSADLRTALAEGGVVALSTDVTLSDVITLDKETTIYLNGNKLDASSNTSRPFELTAGANLTIEATGAEVVTGEYGLVNMTNANLTINGGTFTGNVTNGSFLKIAGDQDMVVTLNNVNYTGTDAKSRILNTVGVSEYNLTVNINGGSYKSGMGGNWINGTIDGATIEATNSANMWPCVCSYGTVTVKNSTLKTAQSAVAVAAGCTISVENCKIEAPETGYAFQVMSTGGTITVDGETTYTGQYGTTGKISSGCPDAVIIINGEEVFRKSAQ